VFDQTSRYHGVPVDTYTDASGRSVPWVTLRIPPPAGAVTGYLVRPVDREDLLANRAYGDPSLWWRICDANPDTGGVPEQLVATPGVRIDLPQPVLPEVTS
jgi:hypothetical protein